MKLFLLRHADALPASSDAQRKLSDKGVGQAETAGRFCRKHDMVPRIVLHSPLVRAAETAARFARTAEVSRTLEADFLSPGMTLETALPELKTYTEFGEVMIIGHEPDFSGLVAELLGVPDHERIHLRKASLTLIQLPEPDLVPGTLEFSVPCKLM